MDPRPYHFEYRKPRFSNPTYHSDHLYQSIYHLGAYNKSYKNIQKIQNMPPYQLPSSSKNHEQSPHIDQLINRRLRQIDPEISKYPAPKHKHQEPQPMSKYEEPQRIQRGFSNDAIHQKPSRQNNFHDRVSQERQFQRQSYENNQNINSNEHRQRLSEQRSYSQEVSTPQKNMSNKEPGYMSNYGDRLMRPMPGKAQDKIYANQQKPYNIINCYPNGNPIHREYPKLTLENKLIETGQYFSGSKINYNPERY